MKKDNELIKHAEAINSYCKGKKCDKCIFYYYGCRIGRSIPCNWRIPKAKILDEVEREYLGTVIRPFRYKVRVIAKCKTSEEVYIVIRLKNAESIIFPNLSNKKMYSGMEIGKEYTLEELGI